MQRVINAYKYFSKKRFSTLAGTLVYFLLMSLAPFILWLTIIFGDVQFDQILSMEIFKGITPFLNELKNSAQGATGGASAIFLITTLYSSTNFFYHMRRSGEIIYSSNRTKGGIKLRLLSLAMILFTLFLTSVLTVLTVFGRNALTVFMPKVISEAIINIFITATALAVCIVLNVFMCPFKIKVSEVLSGSLLTTVLWIILTIGFSVYLTVASPEKLYGRIASVIVFLLWCYLMMNSLIIGCIYNSAFKNERRHKEIL